jgi:hypothetical protein
MADQPEFISATFIETPDGDLIAPSQIASVKYWPPYKGESECRAQIMTVNGSVWELYRGQSEQEAKAARDAMIAKIKAALTIPSIHT